MIRAAVLAALLVACSSSAPPTASLAPPAAVAHGKVTTQKVASTALGVTKDVVVYLPAGYDADPARRWPVYYFLHGLGGDETNWTARGRLDDAADHAGVQAIIVMPDADNSFYTDSVTPVDYEACLASGKGLFFPDQNPKTTCVKTPNYETWITQDLVAWTDATYRTIARRESRAVVGLSMGGFGALSLGLRHKDRYVAAASHSGVDALLYAGPFPYQAGKVELASEVASWGGRDPFADWMRGIFGPDIANWRAHDPATLIGDLKPGELALYLDCGTEDMFRLQNGAMYVHDLLLAKHIEHTFFIGPGKHDFSFWTPRLPETFKFLAANVK